MHNAATLSGWGITTECHSISMKPSVLNLHFKFFYLFIVLLLKGNCEVFFVIAVLHVVVQ